MGLRVQVEEGVYREIQALKVSAGTGVSLEVVQAEGDSADLEIQVTNSDPASGAEGGLEDHIADESGAHAATAISASSTTLVGVGTTVQAVLEELDDAIAAIVAEGGLVTRRGLFVETAAAGVYTYQLAIPAGGVIHSVAWETTAAWDADTTTADFGFTGTLTAYGNDVDVDGVGGDQVFGLDTEDPDDFAAGTTFNAVITTTGAGGTTGRTQVTVVYSVPPTGTTATKVAS
jgi:hypothetical protein